MTQEHRLYNSVAPLRNVSALVTLIEKVRDRAPGLPGMATFSGYSGYGKTTAAVYAANCFDALQVQVKESWTARKFCQSILSEMGILPAKTIADMIDQIAQELALSDRVLIVDDAQYLIKRSMIGHVRDIYESSGATIILIGEERLPQQLQQWENIHGRMFDWVTAEPACLDDVAHLARIYCAEVTLSEAFRAKLLHASVHSIRRVCINLAKVREFALTAGLDAVDPDIWGDRGFFACAAPRPRGDIKP
ncbi:Mobile element protein [Rhodovulum sp. P5]|uniref:DNA transposition protein n=1 Tax=Rhodovulum phage vB_RhkS_P1 TaxID=1873452 RepID=UPI00080AB828|nr:ATP-binding protein [Rhodovulum sp. P5]YP_009285896.1 DNA transposition protein [Rhodovulum phage vB_RhkS_P1]ANT39882.1 mobile element protein [Rhodovulum phage vB_RhkS_P1]ARE38952.1 Mobile element protein [Rhodovulum sp. P5]